MNMEQLKPLQEPDALQETVTSCDVPCLWPQGTLWKQPLSEDSCFQWGHFCFAPGQVKKHQAQKPAIYRPCLSAGIKQNLAYFHLRLVVV